MNTSAQTPVVGLLFLGLLTIGFLNQRVPQSAAEVDTLQVGAPAPDFVAKTPDGEPFEFIVAERDKPALLIFYRGGWCPYCNAHLKELRTAVPQLMDAGYDVLFLSADRPELLRSSLKEEIPDYTLLSDASMQIARDYGIAFRVDDVTVARYKKHGIDLEAASGYEHRQLPVPAVFLIGTDGKIKFMYANPDYKIRLSAKKLLAAAGIAS